jgi:hypothetical protein
MRVSHAAAAAVLVCSIVTVRALLCELLLRLHSLHVSNAEERSWMEGRRSWCLADPRVIVDHAHGSAIIDEKRSMVCTGADGWTQVINWTVATAAKT